MMPPLTLSGLYGMGGMGGGGAGAGAAAGGMAAMGPVGWAMLGLTGLGTMASMFGKKQQPPQFAEAVKVGAKPMINPVNPYGVQQTDPYQMNNMQPMRKPMFSSTIGRYGGFV